ncbi:MAG: hypothetical protein JWQ01_2760 [Massilia sp.]|nr:hypothetical protein [Massilia sp.]
MPTLDEAKTDATRERRVEQAIEWIAEGKGRNWKTRSPESPIWPKTRTPKWRAPAAGQPLCANLVKQPR